MFVALLRRGLLPDEGTLLDLGCGQGLLLSLLRAAKEQHAAGRWPRDWPAPPRRLALRGIDAHARRVEIARRALGDDAHLEERDLRELDLPQPCAVVVLLDVLLYLPEDEPARLLRNAARALAPGGIILLREPDAGGGLAFRLTRFGSWFDSLTRRKPRAPIHYRSAAHWRAELRHAGFTVETQPASQGTPFANVLFVGRKP